MSSKKKPGSAELLIWGIPPKLKKAFKKACADNRTSMKEVIMDAMEKTIREGHV